MQDYTAHYSVMLDDVLTLLDLFNDDLLTIGDLTFGAGGHTFAMANKFPRSKIISCDQDQEALSNGYEQIKERGLSEQINLLETNFEKFPDLVNEKFDFILMDLGVSSHHFDSGERGFSFRFDAKLDMRMDTKQELTAYEIVNTYSQQELADVMRKYGEEKLSWKIAGKICEKREVSPIQTTGELAQIAEEANPRKVYEKRIHPATKLFQALRIEVNRELEVIENVIPRLTEMLKVNGILAIISFHSLEDRIVKHLFKKIEKESEFPFEIITKKPILTSEKENLENSRSRSAKMRVIKRINKKLTKEEKYQLKLQKRGSRNG